MSWTSAILFTANLLSGELTWIDGPTAVPGAPLARNPALATNGTVIHGVFRVRTGGLASMSTAAGGSFTTTATLPDSQPAANKGNKNYPAIAVGTAGSGHVLWGPPSAANNGAFYQRIDAEGVPVPGVVQLSGGWIESISAVVADDELHVLLTAIGDDAATDGLFHVHAPLMGGPFVTGEAWQFPNIVEHTAVAAPGGGLALIGRWDVIKRLDYEAGAWTGFANVQNPPGSTSVGRPGLAFVGDTLLWAAIGWIDAVPSSIMARAGGPNAAWTMLGDSVFDPESADGEPMVVLTTGAQGERVVAWLAATGPRLRVSVGLDAWEPPVEVPGTEDATTFALLRDGDSYCVVFARDDGTLMAGRLGAPALPDDTTGGTTTDPTDATGEAGGTNTDAPGETSAAASSGGDEAEATGGTPTTSAGDGATDGTGTGNGVTDGTSTGGAPFPPQSSAGYPSDQDGDGCSCITGAADPWPLALVVLAWRRRRTSA